MQTLRSLCKFSYIVALVFSSWAAVPPAAQAAETSESAPETVQLLFVQTADGVEFDEAQGVLTLKGVSPATIFFSDRPYRLAGHYTTAEFLELWSEGKDSFLADPPNATLSVFVPGQDDPSELVVELENVRMNGTDLSYDVRILQGKVPAAGGAASLFIDIIGMPLTPMSYAGVARRWTRRAIFY